MSSDQIPGVPDGWELVRIDRPAKGDWFIDVAGRPREYPYEVNGGGVFPIIRKIEKPAKYRPFKDTEEYLPHWGRPVRLKDGVGFDSVVSTSRIGVYVASETLITRYSLPDAFKRLEFSDGTPFGVRIDE
jgi:hypothetical protein